MNNKLGTVKQVDLKFSTSESWLKVRTKKKDSKCENCNKPHNEETHIVFASVEGRVNAHICYECGKYFISQGAEDIQLLRKKAVLRKDKLITQAERLGHKFPTNPKGWGKTKEAHTVETLHGLISKKIKHERDTFHKFLKSPYKEKIEKFTVELEKEEYYRDATPFELFKKIPDVFYDYDSDDDYEHHRWCSYFTATTKIGDKTYSYQWANANGDNSLEDAGFDINSVWETLVEIEPKDEITDTQILDYLESNKDVFKVIDKSIRDFVKELILKK